MAKRDCNARIRKSVTITVLVAFVLMLCYPVLTFAAASDKTHQGNIPCRTLLCHICPSSIYPAQVWSFNSFTNVFKSDTTYREQFHIENSIRSIFKPPKVQASRVPYTLQSLMFPCLSPHGSRKFGGGYFREKTFHLVRCCRCGNHNRSYRLRQPKRRRRGCRR